MGREQRLKIPEANEAGNRAEKSGHEHTPTKIKRRSLQIIQDALRARQIVVL